MPLSKFGNQGGGGKFGGSGGGKPAPASKFGGGGTAAAPPARSPGKFGARQAPEPEGPEEGEEQEQPPQRGGGRFGRTQNAPAGRGGRSQGRGPQRVHVPARGRYDGTRSRLPRPPFLEAGKHLCRVVKTFESYKPGRGPRLNIHLEIIESSDPVNSPGDIRSVGYNTDERAFSATSEEIYAFMRAAAGFATDEDFVATFPNGADQDLIDAAHGNPEAQAEMGPNGQPYGENPLEGQVVEAFGSKGNTSEDGSIQFYNFEWAPAEAF